MLHDFYATFNFCFKVSQLFIGTVEVVMVMICTVEEVVGHSFLH